MTAPDYPGALLDRIRARYEGRDLGPEAGERLVVDGMADEFGVHPNSIYSWAKRFAWRRPAWYRQKRPFRKKRRRNTGDGLRASLLQALQAIAQAGAPCPTNVDLAHRLGCSARGIVVALRALVAAGEIYSEVSGPVRRLRLKDGSRTGFTPPATGPRRRRAPILPPQVDPAERRSSRNAKVMARLGQAADAGEPFPSDKALGAAAGIKERSVYDALKRLVAAGDLKIWRAPNKRRAELADGRTLRWSCSLPPLRSGRHAVIDFAAADAVRALQRMGKVTFDVAVVTGRAWGVTWSVDGKIVGRDALIELARTKRAAAIEQLRSVA